MLAEVSSSIFILKQTGDILMKIWKRVEDATETVKSGINTTLIVSTVAVLIAVVALLVAVLK